MKWHAADVASTLAALEADPVRGLSQAAVAERLARHGPNELAKEVRRSAVALFFGQFRNTLTLLLLGATVLSAAMGEVVDAAIVLLIVLFCAILGFVQEYRAGRALDALKRMLAPVVTVVRDGVVGSVPSATLVPGDTLLLEAGDRIAADARLVETHSLKCDEASLTGESFPVDKDPAPVPADAAVGDRRNLVFAGTAVIHGRARAVVTETGARTEFGRIAEQVTAVAAERSPLERRTAEIGRWLGGIALAVCGLAILASLARAALDGHVDLPLLVSMTMFAIALAVAAVPEALGAIVTGTLAIGMQEMARHNALVRRMPAVETLGCTTVICTDKTGTLTRGEMTARRVFVGGRMLAVSGSGYDPVGTIDGDPPAPGEDLRRLLVAGLLCNDSSIAIDGDRRIVSGDPTEAALIVLAAKAGLAVDPIRTESPRTGEIPFSSERKRMTTLHRMPGASVQAFVKGAPEVLLDRCTALQVGATRSPLGAAERGDLLAAGEAMARDALRVIALACRNVAADGAPEGDELETELTFLGLIGLMDPPRDEAASAVEACHRVRIRPIMITGDHQLTAVAVAREVGIFRDGDAAITGAELDALSDDAYARIVDTVTVYARVSPMDKLRIVQAWKQRGAIVAMVSVGVLLAIEAAKYVLRSSEPKRGPAAVGGRLARS